MTLPDGYQTGEKESSEDTKIELEISHHQRGHLSTLHHVQRRVCFLLVLIVSLSLPRANSLGARQAGQFFMTPEDFQRAITPYKGGCEI